MFLYIKRCNHCGKKYFGVTYKQDPVSYKGSGLRWKNHCRYHGWNNVETIQVWKFNTADELKQFAVQFSTENNIVESTDWFNMIPETGEVGIPSGTKFSEETRKKQYIVRTGMKLNISEEVRKQRSERMRNRIVSEETREKTRQSMLGKKLSDETKKKMSLTRTGKKLRPHSEERRRKNSESQKGKHAAHKSPEHNAAVAKAKLGTFKWTTGSSVKMSRECPGDGWYKASKFHQPSNGTVK
jgi:hypothetical protein